MPAGPLECHRQLRSAHVERDDDPRSGRDLGQPCRREVADANRGDQAVVRGVRRVPFGAVGPDYGDVRIPGAGQVRRVEIGEVVVDVDADHPPGRPHDVAHQSRVITGTRADLEHPVAGGQVEGGRA